MGTPSTATAIHHQHHFYPHNNHYSDYNLSGINYGSVRPATGPYSNTNYSANSTPDLRQTSTATFAPKQSSTNASVAYSSKDSPEMPPPKGKRKADWSDFYRNGVPKEVIVIDDSPEPTGRSTKRVAEYGEFHPTVAGAAVGHADKRRKLGMMGPNDVASLRDIEYGEHSTSTSESSRGRSTAGHYSTGPTSLGSSSSGSQRIMRLDNTRIGDKRKRRDQSDDEDSEVELLRQKHYDPWGDYIPPVQPTMKAKEVTVKVVHDVCSFSARKNTRSTPADFLQRSHTAGQKCDDQDGHYIVIAGHALTDRCASFKYFALPSLCRLTNFLSDDIIRQLGQGTFGKVVEAYDKKNRSHCAIKIIRAVPKYRDASRIELRVLATLAGNDKTNRNRCIHYRECFDFRNHICIVTDLLSESVFDFLKKNSFVPFPSTHIQSFAKQLFTSVACTMNDPYLPVATRLHSPSPPRSQPHPYGSKAREHSSRVESVPDFHVQSNHTVFFEGYQPV